MNFPDPSTAMIAACGGDTVKLFDLSVDHGDPCTLSYTPSRGLQVNCVKWNHTNLVVASAGDDKKISLWGKNGQSLGTLPGSEAGDNNESISAISFSNKGSRYICSGGSNHVVRIWDLRRKQCIKWLKGHTDLITGVMYNCKDEHLASISVKGDLILHNLTSTRATELRDPNGQALRVLDYSPLHRHLLVTAGDDGSVHLWDTTGRIPKASWLKQHSAPITGVCFSPINDKMIASVGLDKRLNMYDSGTKKPTPYPAHEAPFSSLAFRDDGWTVAAGTNNGRIVFYDVRGKSQPLNVLRAFGSSEAVTSICWQRLKPSIVNERSCSAEAALIGSTGEDSSVIPDPHPSSTSSSSSSMSVHGSRSSSGRSSSALDAPSVTANNSGPMSTPLQEEAPHRNHLRTVGPMRLQASRAISNIKDDMGVFSPVAEMHSISPSPGNWRDNLEEAKKDGLVVERRPTSASFPSSMKSFPYAEEVGSENHLFVESLSNPTSRQEDVQSTPSYAGSKSSKSDQSITTPPEDWGGDGLHYKFTHQRQPMQSRFMSSGGQLSSGPLLSGTTFAGLQDPSGSTSHAFTSSLVNTTSVNLHGRISSNRDILSGFPEASSTFQFSSISEPLETKSITGQPNLEFPGLPRRFTTYNERISTAPSFNDGITVSSSPKTKKIGVETREELVNSFSRHDTMASLGAGTLPTVNGVVSQSERGAQAQVDPQQGTPSFTLQLVQRILEETLEPVQKSIHDDVRNLHIELIRQFHINEMEMSKSLQSVLENQAELMREVKSLRKENEQLRRLL